MRVAVVGVGRVGASVAVSVLQAGIAREVLLADLDAARAEGEAMDLAHGAPFYPAAAVRAVPLDDAGVLEEADAVVLAAGRNQRPGETRLDLLRDTARVASDVGRRLRAARGLVVVVSNPVDVLTAIVTEASGLPPARVVGTGTMLDTARLREAVGRRLGLDPRSVHAHVVGEHGDSEVVLWSGARVGGRALRAAPGWTRADEARIGDEVRRAAYEIVKRKGATHHAIGLVTAALLRCLLRDERRVLTVSRVQDGGVAYSLPAVVGRDGAVEVIDPEMDDGERAALARSVEVLREARSKV